MMACNVLLALWVAAAAVLWTVMVWNWLATWLERRRRAEELERWNREQQLSRWLQFHERAK